MLKRFISHFGRRLHLSHQNRVISTFHYKYYNNNNNNNNQNNRSSNITTTHSYYYSLVRPYSSSTIVKEVKKLDGSSGTFTTSCWKCQHPLFTIVNGEEFENEVGDIEDSERLERIKNVKSFLREKLYPEILKHQEYPIQCPKCLVLQNSVEITTSSSDSDSDGKNRLKNLIVESSIHLYLNNYFQMFGLNAQANHAIHSTDDDNNDMTDMDHKLDKFEFFPYRYNLYADEDKNNTTDSEFMFKEYLRKKVKTLQKKLHPDLFTQKSKEEQELSQELSSAVNKGCSVLNSPTKRGVYLLRLIHFAIDSLINLDVDKKEKFENLLDQLKKKEGSSDDDDILNIRLDHDTHDVEEMNSFLMEMMELNERLEELEKQGEGGEISEKDNKEKWINSLREFQEVEITPHLVKLVRELEHLFDYELIKDLNKLVHFGAEIKEIKSSRAKQLKNNDGLGFIVPMYTRRIKEILVKLKYYERLDERVGKICYFT